jgi:phosphohistidine phosphatase SixA
MRHGPAEDVADSGRDFDRELTTSGRLRVRRVAELLVAADERPAFLWASPLVRTNQTAQLVAEICGAAPPTLADALAPGHDARRFLDEALAAATGPSIMLVGHEPDMSDLAEYALAREKAAIASTGGTIPPPFGLVGFDKAMVAIFHIDDATGRRVLARTLDPRELTFR